MYHHLRGALVELAPMLAVVESQGVGYELRVPLSTSECLKGKKDVFLYTSLLVREDEWRLYGFATQAERELFRLVLSVSGVGPSIALGALSALSVAELATALAAGDVGVIRRIKGVGKRLADRLVVELQDRVGALGLVESEAGELAPASPGARRAQRAEARLADAVAVLVELGYQRRVAEQRVDAAYRDLAAEATEAGDDAEPDQDSITVEAVIREALRRRS